MYPRDLPVLAPATAMPMPLTMPFLSAPAAPPGMTLMQIALILWAYRKQTVLIAGTVIFLAFIASWLWPRTYEATATLMVNFEVNDPLGGREFPVGLLGSYLSTQVEMASGSEVLLPMIDRLKLTQKKIYAAGYTGDKAGLRHWVEMQVRKKLQVEQGKSGSQLITVTYAAPSAAEAANVANTVAEIFTTQQYQRLTGPASERAQRYSEQVAELRKKVSRAQEKMVEFRQRTGASADQSAGNEALGPAMIHSLKTQLVTQTVQMAELKTSLGPRHPQVLALQSQINANRKALNTELGVYSGNAAAELEAGQHRLELDSAQSVYKRALDGYDQIMFASLGGYSNIDFVSRAAPPPKPSKPKTGILMLIASIVGLGLGLVLPLAYELINRRVRCRDDIERDHGIPVLIELGPIGHELVLARGLA